MKKAFLVSLIFSTSTFLIFTAGLNGTYAQNESSKSANVGNKICPVTGEKINEKTKATYEYQGKIYNFCCAACIDEFKKNPDKYINKAGEELKGKSDEAAKEQKGMPASGANTGGHCGH